MNTGCDLLVKPEPYEPYEVYIDRVNHMAKCMNAQPNLSDDELWCESMKYLFGRLYGCAYENVVLLEE